jgi:hypothetical protein
MGIGIERNGYSDLKDLGFDLIVDLVNSGGFEVIATDKINNSTINRTYSEYLLKPTISVDPLSADVDQPWLLQIEFNEVSGYINVWVMTPTQINVDFEPAVYSQDKEMGRLSLDNNSGAGKSNFFSKSTGEPYWSCYAGASIDAEAIPLSYQVCVSDHGVFVSMWAESYDSSGDCFNWFLVQRPVDCNTGAIIIDGKAPLVCMFSSFGNSNIEDINSINGQVQDSILHFIVRENDINAPVPPVSSVVPTADSFPLINPLQQVALMEDGSFVLRLPQGFTTSRHIYDYKLDMIAYTSADVLSADSEPSFTLFGEGAQRTYKALNANFPNNTGMRILCQVGGRGF